MKKICTKCNLKKDVSEFYRLNKKYLMAQCKICFKKKVHEYYQKLDRTALTEFWKNSYQNNKEYYNNNSTRWQQKIWYYKNKLGLKEKSKIWYCHNRKFRTKII
jgi:hypothetical protein